MSDTSRGHTQSILKVLKTYNAFYVRFGLYSDARYIWALKNILGGGGGGGGGKKGEKRENRPKNMFFLPLGQK